MRDANKTDAATVVMANKHAKPELEKLERQVEARGKLEDAFERPPVQS